MATNIKDNYSRLKPFVRYQDLHSTNKYPLYDSEDDSRRLIESKRNKICQAMFIKQRVCNLTNEKASFSSESSLNSQIENNTSLKRIKELCSKGAELIEQDKESFSKLKQEFDLFTKDSQAFINDYFDKIKKDIENKRNELKAHTDAYFKQMLNEIDNHKTKCNSLNESSMSNSSNVLFSDLDEEFLNDSRSVIKIIDTELKAYEKKLLRNKSFEFKTSGKNINFEEICWLRIINNEKESTRSESEQTINSDYDSSFDSTTNVQSVKNAITSLVLNALHVLYFNIKLRDAVMNISTEKDDETSILIAIQRVFYFMDLNCDLHKERVIKLVNQITCDVLNEKHIFIDIFTKILNILEDKLKLTKQTNMIANLFEATLIENDFFDSKTVRHINFKIKDDSDFYDAFESFFCVENIHENKTELKYRLKNKHICFESLPEVLCLHLTRENNNQSFKFYEDINLIKYVDSENFFPKKFALQCVLIYNGEKREYELFVSPNLDEHWFKCIDGFMNECSRDQAISKNYTTVCMLVYFNQMVHSDSYDLFKLIPFNLKERFNKEVEQGNI